MNDYRKDALILRGSNGLYTTIWPDVSKHRSKDGLQIF